MSYQKDRDEFIARASAHGLEICVIRKLLSAATTLDRLAVALCNGDWPADNGLRSVKPCSECDESWVPSTLTGGRCQDCRVSERVRKMLPDGVTVDINGDPRGPIVVLHFPDETPGSYGLSVPVR